MAQRPKAPALFGSGVLLAILCTTAADAASQGKIGATSSGSIGITASVKPRAEISGAQDIEFGSANSAGRSRTTSDLCLSTNSLARSYLVTAVGSGTAGALELSNGARRVGYSVGWSSPAEHEPAANPSTKRGILSLAAAATGSGCLSGPGLARLEVVVDEDELDAGGSEAPYTGVLTIMVAPQ